MIPESLTLKSLAAISGVLAGLTVLVRLGRLLEALENVQAEVGTLRAEVKALQGAIAHVEGQLE